MKSFSSTVKEELCLANNEFDCCDKAEYMGLMLFGALINGSVIKFITGNIDVLNKYIKLGKSLGLKIDSKQSGSGAAARYIAEVSDSEKILRILDRLKLLDPSTGVIRYRIFRGLIQSDCCRRAFIKGAFMSGGTVINPSKNYNLEFVTPYLGLSRDMNELLSESGFEFKHTVRKSKYVLYTKNSETISDFLAYLEAFKSQMSLLNIKIEKEIRNDFNRSVNIETANLEKTINASVRQVYAIERLSETIGLENIPDDLRETAFLSLEHKDLSLSELGRLMNPPMTKSGVNRRMKKLIEMAE